LKHETTEGAFVESKDQLTCLYEEVWGVGIRSGPFRGIQTKDGRWTGVMWKVS